MYYVVRFLPAWVDPKLRKILVWHKTVAMRDPSLGPHIGWGVIAIVSSILFYCFFDSFFSNLFLSKLILSLCVTKGTSVRMPFLAPLGLTSSGETLPVRPRGAYLLFISSSCFLQDSFFSIQVTNK